MWFFFYAEAQLLSLPTTCLNSFSNSLSPSDVHVCFACGEGFYVLNTNSGIPA